MKRVFLFLACCAVLCSANASEPKTVITGDEMEIIRGGQAVIFTGNSKVVRGDSVLNADRLVQDKKQGRVDASGNINFKTFTEDRQMVTGSSDKASYDMNTEEINATGSVVILTSSACAYSPSALFLQRDRKIFLTGDNPQPRVVYREAERDSEYSADRITVFMDTKKVFLEGSVHGKMRGKEIEKQ